MDLSAAAWALRRSRRVNRDEAPALGLLLASAAVGLPYLNHAFSRADLPHLTQSIHPFLVGWLALLGICAAICACVHRRRPLPAAGRWSGGGCLKNSNCFRRRDCPPDGACCGAGSGDRNPDV